MDPESLEEGDMKGDPEPESMEERIWSLVKNGRGKQAARAVKGAGLLADIGGKRNVNLVDH